MAVIEVGSGAIRLQIMDFRNGCWREIGAAQAALSLLDATCTNRLDPTLAALELRLAAYREKAARAGAEVTRVIGTAGARRLSCWTPQLASLGIEILTEQEEARLSFIGAVRGWRDHCAGEDVLVIDQGQGSLELVEGTPQPELRVRRAASFPLGARAIAGMQRQSGHSRSALREYVRLAVSDWLDKTPAPRGLCATIVGSTATQLGWEAVKSQPCEKYSRQKVHGATFDLAHLGAALEKLPMHADRSHLEKRPRTDLGQHPMDFISNLLAICEIAKISQVRELRVSTTGTRFGALLDMARTFELAGKESGCDGLSAS